jgi:tectonic-1/3
VLAGTVTQNNGKSAIQQYTDPRYGLSLAADFVAPGASAVTCSGKTDISNRIPVLFGQEMHSYCTLYYNLADLTNNCGTIRRDIYTIQTLTASRQTHVGKFGNTSFLNINDWVSILSTVPSSLTGNTPIVEPVAGTCGSILTEFNIEFLTANFGSTSNPQMGIVGARYSYVSGSISYRCLNSMDCIRPSDVIGGGSNTPGATTQPFRIKSTVSFIPVADDPNLVVPAPPRLIPPLPNDIFYPFSL